MAATLIHRAKVTIVGAGQVGMACAVSLLHEQTCNELVLYDADQDKLNGEVLDLQHAGAFFHGKVFSAKPTLEETTGSDLVVITAGVRQREGESRRDLLGRNVAVFRQFVPPLARLSPNAVFLVVSNPVDVMTYVTWKLSGLPAAQVLGSGTSLDSGRLRVLVAQRLGISAMSVHAHILGEHGDSSVAVWSGAHVAGTTLDHVVSSLTVDVPRATETKDLKDFHWDALHDEVKKSAGRIIKLKGYTNWAIGAAVENIARSILRNERRVIPLSTNGKGFYGLTEDCFLSLPVVAGAGGLLHTMRLPLSDSEDEALQRSIEILLDLRRTVDTILETA